MPLAGKIHSIYWPSMLSQILFKSCKSDKGLKSNLVPLWIRASYFVQSSPGNL